VLLTVATRNAELQLARERAILRDQQREIMGEAAERPFSELDRAYVVLQTSYNRLAANHDQLGSVQAAYENDKVPLDCTWTPNAAFRKLKSITI